jgi:hypothetical protein
MKAWLLTVVMCSTWIAFASGSKMDIILVPAAGHEYD